MNSTQVRRSRKTTEHSWYRHLAIMIASLLICLSILPSSGVAAEKRALTLSKSAITIEVGEQFQLKATLSPPASGKLLLVWHSDFVASRASAHGMVTGISEGVGEVYAETDDGVISNVCTVTVVRKKVIPIQSVSLNSTNLKVIAEKTSALTAKVSPSNATYANEIIWFTTNAKIAKVSGKGLVTGVKAGTCYVYAETSSGQRTSKCKVTVIEMIPVKSISLDAKKATVSVGNTKVLRAKVSPSNATYANEIIWYTTNVKVAKVSAKGVVTGVKKGTCYIYAETSSGQRTAECTITVK